MAKLKKKPARAEKRARNKARHEKGLPAARGARRTSVDPVLLTAMGKGPYSRFPALGSLERPER